MIIKEHKVSKPPAVRKEQREVCLFDRSKENSMFKEMENNVAGIFLVNMNQRNNRKEVRVCR